LVKALTRPLRHVVVHVTAICVNNKVKEPTMQLRFLGKETESGNSPTLYDTDEDMYVIQGWKVEEHPDVLAQLRLPLPENEGAIIVPKALMRHLPKEDHGAAHT
jgi:hypothetical protein